MWIGCWAELQSVKERRCKSAAVSAGKGSGNYGGTQAFSDVVTHVLTDMILFAILACRCMQRSRFHSYEVFINILWRDNE